MSKRKIETRLAINTYIMGFRDRKNINPEDNNLYCQFELHNKKGLNGKYIVPIANYDTTPLLLQANIRYLEARRLCACPVTSLWTNMPEIQDMYSLDETFNRHLKGKPKDTDQGILAKLLDPNNTEYPTAFKL